MRRKLFNLTAALSLALLTAGAMLCARSYRVIDGYQWRRSGPPGLYHNSAVLSGNGVIQYVREDTGYPVFLPPSPAGFQHRWREPFDSTWIATGGAWGFAGLRVNRTGPYILLVTVPDWMPLLAAGLYPAVLIVCYLYRKRRSCSFRECSTCGYDLRATPDRCPECGAVPKGFH